jgi:hypothetical protein
MKKNRHSLISVKGFIASTIYVFVLSLSICATSASADKITEAAKEQNKGVQLMSDRIQTGADSQVAKPGAHTSVLNSVDILGGDNARAAAAPKKANDDSLKSIGDAWLLRDGSLNVNLRSSSTGEHVMALFNYKKGDKEYDSWVKHIGGIKPDELKQIPPWKPGEK